MQARVMLRTHHVQWNLSNTDTLGPIKCVLIREVSSFQGANNIYEVGTWSSVLIREVSSFQGANNIYEVGTWSSVLIREVTLILGCPLRGLCMLKWAPRALTGEIILLCDE